MSKETKVTLNLTSIVTYLLVILFVILAFSLYAVTQVQQQFKEAKPVTPPKLSQLTVTVLMPPDCDDCFDSSAFAAAIRQLPLVNVTENKVAYDSEEGKALIETHKLTRAPAAVITGEIENVSIPGFNKTETAYFFTDTPPPYYDLGQKRVIGRVAVTFITDKGCALCFNITAFGDQLKQVGVTMSSRTPLDAADETAKQLIKKYAITKLPAMLLSGDALQYEVVKQAWQKVGSQESDGTLVLRTVSPPYKDLSTRQVRGLVTATYLTDNSCTDCYNVTLHKLVLQQSFGTQFKGEKYVDISSPSGKTLAQKYNITLVPTILLDKEAEAYDALEQAWPQIGQHFPDGTFVFQKVNLLQGVTYKDLSTGKTMNATAEQ